jgi:hypothetical protein
MSRLTVGRLAEYSGVGGRRTATLLRRRIVSAIHAKSPHQTLSMHAQAGAWVSHSNSARHIGMIDVIGPEDSPEFAAAQELRNAIVDAWPVVCDASNTDDMIYIVAAAKCYGQRVTDIDLVVYLDLKNPQPVNHGDEKRVVYVQSLCLTIELKSHEPDGVQFAGNQVRVRYQQRWSDVSEQALQQRVSLQRFLEAQGLPQAPWITALIWLPNVSAQHLPKRSHNVISSGASWEEIVQRALVVIGNRSNIIKAVEKGTPGPWIVDVCPKQLGRQDIRNAMKALTARLTATPLDRRRIENLSKQRILDDAKQYVDKLGEQLLIFRGRGGTGKTIHLLRLARELYVERDARVLILTYNKALVADLKRLLALMGIADAFGNAAVEIMTVHAFLYRLLQAIQGRRLPPDGFLPRFEENRSLILRALRENNRNRTFVEMLFKRAPNYLGWDYAFVDEGQDWPNEEREILYELYGHRKVVVADGVDQFVRKETPTNWRTGVSTGERQIVTLRKSLRLKSGLCRFALSFAEHMGLDDWRLEKDDSVHGGRVQIVEGKFAADPQLMHQLVQDARKMGNQPIDILVCVPPSLVRTGANRAKYSVVCQQFQAWGYRSWDAVEDEARGSFPTSVEQVRIVQYDSCRGLEGWTCIALGFDQLYDRRFKQHDVPNPFLDGDTAAHLAAARWLMIPVTRAIDTLVLQIASADHVVGRALRAAHEACPDIVDWRSL